MIATWHAKSFVIILFFHHLSYSYSFFPFIFESVKTTSIGQIDGLAIATSFGRSDGLT